jgi:hypothetical protein
VSGPRPLRVVVLHGLLVWAVVLGGVRLFVLQPEQCGEPTAASLRAAAGRATDWLVRNQNPDGTWLYRYDRDADRDLGDYNVVRHAGVIMSLEQAATAGLEGAAEAADAGTAWAMRKAVVREDWTALTDESRRVIPAGASALWLSGLVERRLRTGDPVHDELMRRLGRFLAGQVEDSGAVSASWDPRAGAPVPEDYSPFFTGEVFWALGRLHRLFPDEGWGAPADRIAGYLPGRDDVEGYEPGLPDHWAGYGFAEVVAWPDRPAGAPLTPEEAAYARRQAGFQSMQVRWESQRTDGWFTWVTRGRPTLGAGAGTIGEALGSWWVVAGGDPGVADVRDAVGERALCMAGVLERRQVATADAAGHPSPERVEGAWFQFGVTQMDDQQHALSALLLAIPIAEERAG